MPNVFSFARLFWSHYHDRLNNAIQRIRLLERHFQIMPILSSFEYDLYAYAQKSWGGILDIANLDNGKTFWQSESRINLRVMVIMTKEIWIQSRQGDLDSLS